MEERVIRRGGRISLEVPITVSGTDVNGNPFTEKTRTVMLSRHGAKVLLHHQPMPDQTVVIRQVEKQREAPARIAWQRALMEGNYHCGVEFLDIDINFWEMDFPGEGRKEGVAASFLLECSRCHLQKVFDLDSFDENSLRINQFLMRPCPHCQGFVMWNIPPP